MKPILLFDLDGVIADSWAGFFREICQFLEKIGLSHLGQPDIILKMFEGNFILNLVQAISPKTMTHEHFSQIQVGLRQVMNHCQPYKGIEHALYALAEEHKLLLVTSNDTLAASQFLNRHNLYCFDQVIGADIEPSKHKKIQSIQKRYPGHTLYYIGDTLGDLLEARSASAHPVAAGWGWHDRDTLLQGQPVVFLEKPADLSDQFASILLKLS